MVSEETFSYFNRDLFRRGVKVEPGDGGAWDKRRINYRKGAEFRADLFMGEEGFDEDSVCFFGGESMDIW